MRMKYYSRPRDRSLQAFKDWMHGKSYRLNPDAAGTMILEPWIDNQQWVDYCKKFWAKVDGSSPSKKSSEA